MRVQEVDYYCDGKLLETYGGDDIQVPRVGDSVRLNCDARIRTVFSVLWNGSVRPFTAEVTVSNPFGEKL
jgi:hypothetical protein